ncbi:MAG: hypothetical protein ACLVH0_04265 [Coprococcus eutactus]
MICEDILKLTEYGMVTGLVPEEKMKDLPSTACWNVFELEEVDEDVL